MSFSKGSVMLRLWPLLAVLAAGCAGTAGTGDGKPSATVERVGKEQAPAGTAPAGGGELAKLDEPSRQTFAMATGAMKNSKFEVAESMLRPLLDKYPDFGPGWANLAIIFYHTDRLADAEKTFELAARKNEQSAVVYNYLGLIKRQQGEFAKAQEKYAKAILLDPNYTNAYLNLGILYDLYLGDLRKALESYQQYQRLTGDEDKEVAKWIVDLKRRL